MRDPVHREHLSQSRRAPEDEETRDESYAAVWQRLRGRTPELIGRARQRREDVERLCEELMRAEPARQFRMIREPRFQSLGLLDWLLEQSHERQLSNPAGAAQLARLALRLGTAFKTDRTEAVAALPRAFCLGANALRLDSRLAAADVLLARGSLFLADSLERAFHCRTLAVLRWEQARTDEAQALLEHAVRLYGRDGLEGDAALSRLLLGLVRLETGDGDALQALHRGWPEVDRDADPLAALRGGLALAASLAQAGQGDRARDVLRQAWGLYSRVTDPREMHRVVWWEGRTLAGLGDHEEGLELLESVRRQLFAEPSPAEAALVSIDLARLMLESHRSAGIEGLAQELTSAFPGVPVLALAAEGIRSLVHLERPDEPSLREAGSAIEITLRRAFRVCGLGIRPFPVG
jgi:tetratricopeptide (TPR) repeat protein